MSRLNQRLLAGLAALSLAACGGQPAQQAGPMEQTPAASGEPGEPPKPPPVKKEARQLFADAERASARDPGRAISLLESAVDEDAKFCQAYVNIGLLYEKQGKLDQAKDWYKKSAEKAPNCGEGLAQLGVLYLKDDRNNEAAASFQRAVQLEELNGTEHLNLALMAYEVLAKTYYALRKYELARLVCEAGLGLDNTNAPLHNMLGLVYIQMQNLTGALKKFEDAIKANADYADAHLNLGSLTFGYRDYETAFRAFDAAAKLQPKNVEAVISRAVALRGLGRLDEAEAGYRKGLEMDPKHVGGWFNLGLLHQEYTQKLDEAIKAYESVLRFAQDAELRKKATQRIQACRIQMQNQKMLEEQLQEEKRQEEQRKREEAAEKAKEAAEGKKDGGGDGAAEAKPEG